MKSASKLLAAGLALYAMSDNGHSFVDDTPRQRRDTSKPASLSHKEWKKRKRKIKATKIARRHNRR